MNNKLMDLVVEGLWFYDTDPDDPESGHGIVAAKTKEQAAMKVKRAYLLHGYVESELVDIRITRVKIGGSNYFPNTPDVLETL